MKVERSRRASVGRSGGSTAAKPADKTGGFAKIMGADRPQPAESTSPAAESQTVGSIEALLALQASPDATDRQRRAVNQASSILDHLDLLRIGLLEGRIGVDSLRRLRALVAAERERVDDPALSQLLDEIALRAEVELAKHERD